MLDLLAFPPEWRQDGCSGLPQRGVFRSDAAKAIAFGQTPVVDRAASSRGSLTRLQAAAVIQPGWRVVRPSMAERRLLVFRATCGVTFMPRNLADESGGGVRLVSAHGGAVTAALAGQHRQRCVFSLRRESGPRRQGKFFLHSLLDR